MSQPTDPPISDTDAARRVDEMIALGAPIKTSREMMVRMLKDDPANFYALVGSLLTARAQFGRAKPDFVPENEPEPILRTTPAMLFAKTAEKRVDEAIALGAPMKSIRESMIALLKKDIAAFYLLAGMLITAGKGQSTSVSYLTSRKQAS